MLRTPKKIISLVIIVVLVSFLSDAAAAVRMPAIFSNNMVLQQKSNAAVWGWAEPGEKIEVKGSWNKLNSRSTCAGKGGKWIVKIKTPAAGGPFKLEINGNNSITFNNVMIGEVWLCSGQSNMSMPLGGWKNQPIENSSQEIKNANYPNIRLFTVQKNAADRPEQDCKGRWQKCSPATAPSFSAVGYFFGKELYRKLNVPIGLIHSSWPGTPAASWTRKAVLENDKGLKSILGYFNRGMLEWQNRVKKIKAQGKPEPRMPFALKGAFRPSSLYNGMIHPLIPFGIKGVIWYQGESNARRAYQYRKLFPAMIKNWRGDWGIGNFSFYFVQLASFVKQQPGKPLEVKKGSPVDNDWAELREAQLLTLKSVPHTGMAVTIDIGKANCIHPTKKKEVGQRLALWALAKDYGVKNIVYSGPIYKAMDIEGDKIRIRFDYARDGLIAKGGKVEGFAIAGADRKFVWAEAKIDGDTVVVRNDSVKEPVAVRYAWAKYPFCNLYNNAMLPASPFRTDDWPGITIGVYFDRVRNIWFKQSGEVFDVYHF